MHYTVTKKEKKICICKVGEICMPWEILYTFSVYIKKHVNIQNLFLVMLHKPVALQKKLLKLQLLLKCTFKPGCSCIISLRHPGFLKKKF